MYHYVFDVLDTMGVTGFVSKVFIIVFLVNQNFHAASAQSVNLPFKSISVSSKTGPSAVPCAANTLNFSPASLPPVQTQAQQNLGQNYQALGQTSAVGYSPNSQVLGQLSNPGQYQGQYYQPLGLSSGVTQNVEAFNSGQNLVFTQNQNQNSGLNNLVASPVTQSCSSSSSSPTAALNIVSGSSPSQGSTSFNFVPPTSSSIPSSISVASSQNPGVNCGSYNLVTLNSNYVPPQSSSSNNVYPVNIISNTGCSGGVQNVESLSFNNGYNSAILPPSVPVSNSGVSPQFSFNIQPSQSCSSNSQPVSGLAPQPSLNVQPSSQGSNKPTFTLTDLRPLNLNSGSNVKINSISFQPSCNTLPQLPSALPSANPVNLAQSNQYSFNVGVSPSLLQDLNNVPSPTYNPTAQPCAQNTPQLSISTNCGSNNQQLNSPSNLFYPVQNTNSGSQQTTPSINFGQFTLQNPISSGSPSCSNQPAQPQSQNLNSVVSSCNSQVSPPQNFVLDQQLINQIFSSIVSNTPVQSSSCNSQVNVPQVNNYVQSSLSSIPTTYTSNVGSSYVPNCGSSQNLGNLIQTSPNSQASSNIIDLYNQQSANPYAPSGFQSVYSSPEYTNTVSSLPSVYTSNLASPTNSNFPSLTPTSIISAYNSNFPSTPINYESILSALSSPTITTNEIASLVSSLAESVLQQCNSLTSSSAYPQSNVNALPISVSTSPMESNYVLPTLFSQYLPQQQSVSFCNTPSVEIVESSCQSSGTQTGIPIKITVSDAPFSSDISSGSLAPSSSGQSYCSSSNVQPNGVESSVSSVLPPVFPPIVGGSSGKSSGGIGTKDLVKILVFSELLGGGSGVGCGGCGGGSGLDGGLLALLLATAT